MSCGNREGISNLPCSTLKSVDVQCSIALAIIGYRQHFSVRANFRFTSKGPVLLLVNQTTYIVHVNQTMYNGTSNYI